MKPRFLAILCGVGLLPVGFAFSKAVFTEFTGRETLAAALAAGTVSCPGGQPTGQWPQGPPCSPGSRFHVRGLTFLYQEFATDPRMTGDSTVVANANWDGFTNIGPGSGPMWGTIRLEVKKGGVKTGDVWEGTWEGIRTVGEDGAYSDIHVVMHGSEGTVLGLTSKWDLTYTPASPLGYFSGRLISPASR